MPNAPLIDPRFDENPTLPGVPDPHPIYRTVRQADPVRWCAGAKIWAVMRYADAQFILKHPRLSRQAYLDHLQARTGSQPIIEMQRHELVFMDNPRHEILRHLIGEAINANAMRSLKEYTDTVVANQLAPLLSRGEFDVIGDFLQSLPTSVAAAWLGIPEADRERITACIFPLVGGRGVTRDAKTMATANRATDELHVYFRDLVQQRRRTPTGDLISSLVIAKNSADSLSEEEIFALVVAVFGAGHTPGIALMAGTLLALLKFPDQWKRLRADLALLPSAVEEGLRYETPTQAPNPQTALEDISVGGKTIGKGEDVTVILASANRDPEVFSDPDRFDVSRSPNHHLAFSSGAHYCIGAMLSRMQAQSVLAAFTRQLPELRLACDPGELRWIPHDRFRVLASLPVRFSPVAN